jgi:hypothetical protein
MFEQVTLLLSFVYVIALTHLLSSASELIQARNRVKFSALQAFWMVLAFSVLFLNWIQAWQLHAVPHWTMELVTLQFIGAVAQYFGCALVSMKVEAEGPVDMEAFYERERPAYCTAFLVLSLIAMVQNFLLSPLQVSVVADLMILPLLAMFLIAGFAKSRRLQWLAAGVVFIVTLAFAAIYMAVEF